MRGRSVLSTQLEEYLKGMEADEGKDVTSDLLGKWRKAAADLTYDILQQVSRYGKDVASQKEDALGPLRRAIGRVAGLSEAINAAKAAPEEGGL